MHCCTFGDLTDVQWWREFQLPTAPSSAATAASWPTSPNGSRPSRRELYGELAGKTTFTARELTVAALAQSGDLDGDPQPTQRMANFYERGDKPLEIVSTASGTSPTADATRTCAPPWSPAATRSAGFPPTCSHA